MNHLGDGKSTPTTWQPSSFAASRAMPPRNPALPVIATVEPRSARSKDNELGEEEAVPIRFFHNNTTTSIDVAAAVTVTMM